MKKELDEALVRDFPLTFRDRNGDKRLTCMCWGFECGDGWEPLIREACEVIEREIANAGPAEYPMCAMQVKEKFGTLRFYMTSENDAISDAICTAEKKSSETCEVCGKPGGTCIGGWSRTLCNECSAKDS